MIWLAAAGCAELAGRLPSSHFSDVTAVTDLATEPEDTAVPTDSPADVPDSPLDGAEDPAETKPPPDIKPAPTDTGPPPEGAIYSLGKLAEAQVAVGVTNLNAANGKPTKSQASSYACALDTFPGQDMVYSFTAQAAGVITLEMLDADPETAAHLLVMKGGACDPATCLTRVVGAGNKQAKVAEGSVYCIAIDGPTPDTGGEYAVRFYYSPPSIAPTVCRIRLQEGWTLPPWPQGWTADEQWTLGDDAGELTAANSRWSSDEDPNPSDSLVSPSFSTTGCNDLEVHFTYGANFADGGPTLFLEAATSGESNWTAAWSATGSPGSGAQEVTVALPGGLGPTQLRFRVAYKGCADCAGRQYEVGSVVVRSKAWAEGR